LTKQAAERALRQRKEGKADKKEDFKERVDDRDRLEERNIEQ